MGGKGTSRWEATGRFGFGVGCGRVHRSRQTAMTILARSRPVSHVSEGASGHPGGPLPPADVVITSVMCRNRIDARKDTAMSTNLTPPAGYTSNELVFNRTAFSRQLAQQQFFANTYMAEFPSMASGFLTGAEEAR